MNNRLQFVASTSVPSTGDTCAYRVFGNVKVSKVDTTGDIVITGNKSDVLTIETDSYAFNNISTSFMKSVTIDGCEVELYIHKGAKVCNAAFDSIKVKCVNCGSFKIVYEDGTSYNRKVSATYARNLEFEITN